MTFGERFKQLRLEKGLKQQELIEEFNKAYGYNFSKSSISQYENNKKKPEINALISFASYFDVSIDFLLGISENKNHTIIPIKDNQYEIVLAKEHFEISKLMGKIYENAYSVASELCFDLDFEINVTSLNLFSSTYKIDQMAACFMESLKWELNEITNIYAYAVGSDRLSKALSSGPIKNHIIYCQRNLHFRNFFHRWFAMLEHIAFMINNFSKLELINEDNKVSIYNIRTKMKSIGVCEIGYISCNDFKRLLNLISEDKIYKNIDTENLKEFRNILVHRFHIDPDLKVLVSFDKDKDNLNFKFYKTFFYDEYISHALNILSNLYDILNELSRLDLMKNVILIKSNK